MVSLDGSAKNCVLCANCNTANTVTVVVYNGTGGTQTIGTVNVAGASVQAVGRRAFLA